MWKCVWGSDLDGDGLQVVRVQHMVGVRTQHGEDPDGQPVALAR